MKRLDTSVKQVNVFRHGSEVIRTGSLELSEGANALYVYGITSGIDADTVKLFTKEGVLMGNFRFLTSEEKENGEKESDAIKREIESLKKENEIRAMQAALYEANGNFTNRTSLNAEEVEAYIEALPKRLLGLSEETAACEAKIREAEKKLNEAVKKENYPILYTEVTAPAAGTYPFEVRYQELSGGWEPVFEIHTDAKEPLEIRMRARISQNTGEDWKGISVSLFSGDPSYSGTLPEVLPVYLDFQEEVRARAMPRMAMAMGASMKAAVLEDAVPMEMEAANEIAFNRVEAVGAEVSEDDTMTEYILPGARDIYSGNEGAMADLLNYTIPASYRIASAPRKDPHAYLTAEIKTADLPPRAISNAQIYLKGIYAGDVSIDPDFSEETVNLSLGQEERVHVTSKQVSKKTSNTLLKGLKNIEYVYETGITNNTPEPIEAVLKDQIPVSENKSITVEPIDLGGAERNEETGILTKTITVQPKETVTVKLSYKVSYPKDKRIKETVKTSWPKFCHECGSPMNGPVCTCCGKRY